MKELSIEEKAQRYDEVIKKLKILHDDWAATHNRAAKEVEPTFPELKESEDEQHRKWILEYLYDGLRKSDEQFKCQFKCAIAWLEKQGKIVDYYEDRLDECACKYFNKGYKQALEKQRDANKEYWRGYREGKQEILDKYAELEKQGEQSLAWSEEDEKIYQSIMDDTVQENQLSSNQINWLRDIKYRYFPQLKQKWSEEDEDILNTIINHFEIDLECTKNDDIIRWLKSLKPHNKWKPSEGQLECLEYAIEKAEKDWSPLTNNRIYLTLKALKEHLEKL